MERIRRDSIRAGADTFSGRQEDDSSSLDDDYPSNSSHMSVEHGLSRGEDTFQSDSDFEVLIKEIRGLCEA